MDEKVKQLLERIRTAAADTAADAAVSAAGAARQAGRRCGQMVDAAKLNVQLFDLNNSFDELLRQMGRVMYDTHQGSPRESAEVAALLEQADQLSGQIREVKERIAALRQSKTCPGCGELCAREDVFCRRCGREL